MLGCQPQSNGRSGLGAPFTSTIAQRSIEVGADTAQVLAALGSPNIVSTDADRNEVWVYDRVNTIKQRSSSESGLLGAGAASIGSLLVGVAPAHNQRSGASISSQRTLTVIIHFDGTGRVRDYSYHASRF